MTLLPCPILAAGFPPQAGIILAVFIGFVVLALAFRLLGGAMDNERIGQYVRERGGKVRSIHWSPFGRGWFGEKRDRIYEVVYCDADGNEHFATCKTSLFGGVFWTEDQIVQAKGQPVRYSTPRPADDVQFLDQNELQQENRRLREEVTRLRQELKRRES